MKEIITLVSFFIAGFLFSYLRSKIAKHISKTAKEKFDSKKFTKGMFHLTDKVAWAKDIYHLFNIRKLIIYALIVGSIYGYGWYKGRINSPVVFNMEGKNAYIKLNDHYLHIKPDGTADVVDKDKKTILKEIKVSDIPELRKRLKPIGFQLKPIGVLGFGVGKNKTKFEGGAGISFLKYWKWRLDAFLTNMGIYLGTSRKVSLNSALGIGVGKGYKGDNRILFYYSWSF